MLTKFYQELYITKNLSQTLSRSIVPFITTEKYIRDQFAERQKIDSESIHLNELLRDIQRIKSLMADLSQKN